MAQELTEKDKWILKAENDLRIIEKDLSSADPINDVICFHAQQAAEKYLKAYLVHKSVIPEKSHIIERLLDTCSKYDPSFAGLMEAAQLTEYAVELRYPDDFYIPDIEEAKEAYNLALKVKDFVLERIK